MWYKINMVGINKENKIISVQVIVICLLCFAKKEWRCISNLQKEWRYSTQSFMNWGMFKIHTDVLQEKVFVSTVSVFLLFSIIFNCLYIYFILRRHPEPVRSGVGSSVQPVLKIDQILPFFLYLRPCKLINQFFAGFEPLTCRLGCPQVNS